jgi:hypothetical protein
MKGKQSVTNIDAKDQPKTEGSIISSTAEDGGPVGLTSNFLFTDALTLRPASWVCHTQLAWGGELSRDDHHYCWA